MADAGGTILGYVKGSVALGNTFGTQIATPAIKRVRISTDTLARNIQTAESPELVPGYDVEDIRPVAEDVGGQVTAPLLWGNFDDWIEALLFSTWQLTPQRFNAAADQEITDVAAATGVITILAAAAGNPNRAGTFAIGHLVRSSAFTNAGNNFLKRASAASSTSVTVSTAGLVNEAAPPAAARLKAVGFEGAAADITATAGGTNSIGATALNLTTLGLARGMWLKVGGTAAGNKFATAANNGWVRISVSATTPITATTIILDRVPAGWATDAGTGKTIQVWVPDWITNAADALVWFDLERQLPQLATDEYHYLISCVPTSLVLAIQAGQLKDAQMAFIGASGSEVTARVAGATDPTADSLGTIPRVGSAFDASNNVAQIAEGGSLLTDVVTGLTWTIANGVQGLRVVGRRGFGRITRQRFRPTVALQAYYDSKATLDKLGNDTETSLHSIFTDPNGTRAFIVDYPSAKLASGAVQGIQADGQLQVPYGFSARRQTNLSASVMLCRLEEYAV